MSGFDSVDDFYDVMAGRHGLHESEPDGGTLELYSYNGAEFPDGLDGSSLDVITAPSPELLAYMRGNDSPVLPDILEWVRGIRVADTVFNDYTYRASRLLYFDNALDESNIETAVRWLSDYGYVPRAFCGVGYAIELTDGYGGLSDQAVVQYAIDMIIKDGRYYPVLDESDYERREDAWLRDYFDGEVTDAMLGGADRDAVFEAWRDDADPVSGDMYFDVEKLPGYIETAKGGKRNA